MDKKHILIVDDDHELPGILKHMIEILCPHCLVWVAHNAHAALKLINARSGTPFHLILTDFEMPHMNGVDFASAVRSQWPAANIVLMSGSGREQLLSRLTQQHNLNSYLRKPVGINRLQQLLDSTTTPQKGAALC